MYLFNLYIAFISRFLYISSKKRIECLLAIHSLLLQSRKGRYFLMKKLITSLLTAALLVSSIPVLAETDKPKAAEQIYYDVYSSDWPSLNYMYESSSEMCANFIDTLVEYDNYGILQPCLAESWECSEDGLTWTFHLRKGVKWMTADMEEYGADVKRILSRNILSIEKSCSFPFNNNSPGLLRLQTKIGWHCCKHFLSATVPICLCFSFSPLNIYT